MLDLIAHIVDLITVAGRSRHTCRRRPCVKGAEVLLLETHSVVSHLTLHGVNVCVGAYLTLQSGGKATAKLVTEATSGLTKRVSN